MPQANLLSRLSLLFFRRTTFVSFEHNTHLAKRAYEIGYRMTSHRVDWVFADAATTLHQALARLYRTRPRTRRIVPLVSFARSHSIAGGAPSGPFRGQRGPLQLGEKSDRAGGGGGVAETQAAMS